MTITGNFERFQYFKQTFSKKLEYRSLVESTNIDNATFPYKTALSASNVKRNRMGSTKWTCHKERTSSSNYFSFSKILFQFKNLVQRVDLTSQMSIFLLSQNVRVLSEGAFSVWVSLKPAWTENDRLRTFIHVRKTNWWMSLQKNLIQDLKPQRHTWDIL